MSNRSKAFFINGGAGRVLCSIPALEKYAEESGDEDFVIVCEGGMEFYKGHPILHEKAYDINHKGLFENHLKTKDIVSPEPYRVFEYYNQEANLIKGFDIEINGRDSDKLKDPSIFLSKAESIHGFLAVQEMKQKTGKDKVLVFQPFGRGVTQEGDFIFDTSSRSFEFHTVQKIIETLREHYCVVVMSEFEFPMESNKDHPVPIPQQVDLRHWAAIINASDHFLGCDSVGQHLAKAMGKSATVVVGSTFPENISYPHDDNFDVIDVGFDQRVYQPIRISVDDMIDRVNNECMMLTPEQELEIITSIKTYIGEPVIKSGDLDLPTYAGTEGEEVKNFIEV